MRAANRKVSCWRWGAARLYARLVAVHGSAAVAWAAALSTAGPCATKRIPWTKALPMVVVSEIASGTTVVIR